MIHVTIARAAIGRVVCTQEHLQIISTCKHFFGYDIETGRSGNDVNISARMLVEYYLPAFDWDCRL